MSNIIKKTVFMLVAAVLIMPMVARAEDNPKKYFELKFNHIWAPTSAQNQLFKEWADRVEQASGGRVNIVLYPGSTLSNPVEAWDGLKAGAFDIGSAFVNYHRTAFEFTKAQLYFWVGAPSIEFGMRYMEKFQKKYPILLKEFDGAKLLWTCAQGPRQMLLASKPVHSVEDMKGLKLRAAIPAEVELVKSLGATAPSFVPMGQVYSALQKNMYDGLWVSTEVLKSFRLAEVVKFVVNASLEVGHGKYVAMNQKVWDSLPSDIQGVIEKECSWAKEEDIKLWTKADEEGLEFAKSSGTEYIKLPQQELDKFMAKVRPIQDQVAKEMDAKGYPGTALLNDVRQAIESASKEK